MAQPQALLLAQSLSELAAERSGMRSNRSLALLVALTFFLELLVLQTSFKYTYDFHKILNS